MKFFASNAWVEDDLPALAVRNWIVPLHFELSVIRLAWNEQFLVPVSSARVTTEFAAKKTCSG